MLKRSAALAALAAVAAAAAPAAAAERIAFTEMTRDASGVAVVGPDGSGRTPVTAAARGVASGEPDWSPDGTRIAFSSFRDRGDEPSAAVYTMAADGSGVRRLLEPPRGAIDVAPAWSPDGGSLAFVRVTFSRKGFEADLYVARADGTGAREVVVPGTTLEPAWSPDGTRIGYTVMRFDDDRERVSTSVWHVAAAGGVPRMLAAGASSPAWSPDGARIALARRPACDGGGECAGGELHTVAPDGSDDRRLTATDADEGEPAWSPDGRRIAFTSNAFYPRGDSYELYAMRADGSCVVRLTAGAAEVSTPAWSPAAPGSADADECAQPDLGYAAADLSEARRERRLRLLWLGDWFEGLVPSSAHGDDGIFAFRYGDCVEPAGACAAPLALQVASICDAGPLDADEYLGRAEARFVARGALVTRHRFTRRAFAYVVHSGRSSVLLEPDAKTDRARIQRVIAALRPFGAADAAAPLAPPALRPSQLRHLRRVAAAVRRHGLSRASRRLRISRRTLRSRVALARVLRRLPAASAADRRAVALCDRRSRRR